VVDGKKEGKVNEYANRISRYLELIASRRQRGEERIRISDLLEDLTDITYGELSGDLKDAHVSIYDDRTLVIQDAERLLRSALVEQQLLTRDISPKLMPIPVLEPSPKGRRPFGEAADLEDQYRRIASTKSSFLLFPARVPAPIIPKEHQIRSVKAFLFETYGTAILADEVGLGKTLTACFVMLELFLRDPKLTCLVLVPPNLIDQWTAELSRLRTAAALPALKFSFPTKLSAGHAQRLILMSTDRAKIEHNSGILMQGTWDLVIVDEAHELRNPDTARHKLLYSLTARRRLLVSATPVNNSAYDIYHLVNLIRPGYLGNKESFRRTYAAREREVLDPVDFQQRLKGVMIRETRGESEIKFAKRVIQTVDVLGQKSSEGKLYREVLHLLRGVWKRHRAGAVILRRASGEEQGVDSLVLIAMMVLRELGSHPRAALATLRKALRPELQKAKDLEALEKLDKVLADHEGEQWRVGTHAKTDRLMELLPELVELHGKLIVFNEFRETQDALAERAEEVLGTCQGAVHIFQYHGDLTRAEKTRIIMAFNSSTNAILISTDAGGQGLNLQTASAVVNFDFPWNPMRIEQRIGRVDRIGQQCDRIKILNFLTKGTIEEYVYLVLEEKLRVCEDVLGSFESPVLRLMLARRDEELGIGQIILASENEKDMAEKFRKLSKEADAYRRVRVLDAKNTNRSEPIPSIPPSADLPLLFSGHSSLGGAYKGRKNVITVWRIGIGLSLSVGPPTLQFFTVLFCECCGEAFVKAAGSSLANAGLIDGETTSKLKISETLKGLRKVAESLAAEYYNTENVGIQVKRLADEMRRQSQQLKSLYTQTRGDVPMLRGFPRRVLHSEAAIEAEREAHLREISERFQCPVHWHVLTIGSIDLWYPQRRKKKPCAKTLGF
jgi:SNF2 family DNA or RNA helicase